MGEPVNADKLLALLKNPLVFSGGDRGNHLRWTRNLEIYIRKYGMPFPTEEQLVAWANGEKDEGVGTWASLIGRAVSVISATTTQPLPHLIKVHLKYAELLSTGDGRQGDGALWLRDEGEKALQTVTLLQQDAVYGNDLSPRDYQALFHRILANEEVRDREQPRPDVFIWGTLEARVGGADIVILAGLNEGSWPEAAAHDPWLNRKMRNEVGLLSPDRKLGLSAHDFQIAAAGPKIWLSRSARSSDAETVPSRWLNRLQTLFRAYQSKTVRRLIKECWHAAISGSSSLLNWKSHNRKLHLPNVLPRAHL
jgi:inactivated superfamily I helicase